MRTRPIPALNPPLDDYREYIFESNAIVILYAKMAQNAALIPDDDALAYALSGMIGVCRLSRDVMRDLKEVKEKECTADAA
jgi:glutathione S-transferase